MTEPGRPPKTAYYTASSMGVLAGVIDLFVPSPQIAPAVIVVASFLMSLAYPREAWHWALLVGVFVPLAHLIAGEFGYMNIHRPVNLYFAYLALVPAFIGAYSAFLLRRWGRGSDEQGSGT